MGTVSSHVCTVRQQQDCPGSPSMCSPEIPGTAVGRNRLGVALSLPRGDFRELITQVTFSFCQLGLAWELHGKPVRTLVTSFLLPTLCQPCRSQAHRPWGRPQNRGIPKLFEGHEILNFCVFLLFSGFWKALLTMPAGRVMV